MSCPFRQGSWSSPSFPLLSNEGTFHCKKKHAHLAVIVHTLHALSHNQRRRQNIFGLDAPETKRVSRDLNSIMGQATGAP